MWDLGVDVIDPESAIRVPDGEICCRKPSQACGDRSDVFLLCICER